MRRRLLTVLTALMAVATLLLALPLADAYARGRTEHLLLQRRADAVRFAELADRVRTDADRAELAAETTRYAELYRAGVDVVDAAGRTVGRSGPADDGPAAAEARGRALTGRSTDRLPTVRPWGPGTVVLAEPVGHDERVSGAVLLTVPTDAARHDVLLRWALIAAGALAAFAAAALVAAGTARWLLRPVGDLDRAVEQLAAGSLRARAALDAGPPELRRLRRNFNTMAEAVADALTRQRAFVADASHQLRNPLATLVLQLENVEPHLPPGPGRQEHTRALDEAERLGELLDGLLALARVEAATAHPVEQDLSAAVAARVAAWEPVFAAAGLHLTADTAPGLRVRAVPDATGRILDAVLDNAAKFVPAGGRVTVLAARGTGEETGADSVTIEVTDTGPGVPADQLPLLVRRFTRAPEHQNLPGSGLGLAIADEIARMSGGRLRVRPAEPHGLAVDFRLPAAPRTQP
ncbi:HAMP domain-containing sensor histidine kinase [Kitasatospora sp. NPDC085879]|uniref:sensor histidine kinase n=1 Tax=Kitasatospora sp. NPDC085879 TaxID=3154769 RepID=UPI003431A2C3